MLPAGVAEWVTVPALPQGTQLEEQMWGRGGGFISSTLFIVWTPQHPRKLVLSRGSAGVCGTWIHEWREASVPSTPTPTS